MHISNATEQDIPALLSIINNAFRGDSARQGWTHESDLIVGEIRTDADTLLHILKDPDTALLKYVDDQGDIQGCVNLHHKARGLYLGMLTVNPALQGAGIGKKLLAKADEHARNLGCSCIYMTVISVRTELIDWYLRHGYALTGETEPFLVDAKYGKPSQDLYFSILEKKMPVD
jgi:ribosomal protein S18 acetylase RimI-like enzyme